jgi:hypothetical protein
MSKRLFRRGLVAVSACSLALATATVAHAASTTSWQLADVVGPVGGGSVVNSVAATGAQDVWAAGNVFGNGSTPPQIFLAQWSGTAWQQVTLPSSITSKVRNPGYTFVGASSSSDVWAFVQASAYTYALHWNGSAWTSQRLAVNELINSTEVFSPTNAWAFGSQTEKSILPYNLHYNGKTWSKVTLPLIVDGVSATSASNMWVFGTKATTPTVMHWNGKSWSTLSLPSLGLPTGEGLNPGSIATVSPTDVWVASGLSGGMGVASGYVLLHWNGTTWQRITIPASYKTFSVGYVAQDGDGGIWLSAYKDEGAKQYFYHDSASGTWTQQAVPTETGISQAQVGELTWVPGTTSEVAGGTLVATDGDSQGAIYQYGG